MWSILTPRRNVPISTIYLRRHPERSRGIPRPYLEAFAFESIWHRDEELSGKRAACHLNSIGRRERLPYTKCKKSGTWRRFIMQPGRARLCRAIVAPRSGRPTGLQSAPWKSRLLLKLRRSQRPRLQNFFKFFARNLKLNRLGFDRTNGARRP